MEPALIIHIIYHLSYCRHAIASITAMANSVQPIGKLAQALDTGFGKRLFDSHLRTGIKQANITLRSVVAKAFQC